MDADLDVVEIRTEKLSNEGAKHRISVKPKSRRASTKTSMRQKEVGYGEAKSEFEILGQSEH